MPFGYEIVIILTMLVFNAVFAAYEMALASVSRVRLAVLINEKKHGAVDAAFMKDRMEASLAVVQLGITLFGAIAAATGGAGVTHSFSPYLMDRYGFSIGLAQFLSLVALIIPLSCFSIIFGELVPKIFAINNKEWVCLKLSPWMKMIASLTFPIVLFFEKSLKLITKIGKKHWQPKTIVDENQSLHELKAAANLAKASRLIGTREEKIVLSAAQLSVRPVKHIMLSVQDISMLPISATLSEALIRAHMDMHTRFPVSLEEGNPQTISGYINFKDIVVALKLNPNDPSIKGIARPIKTVNQNTPIAQALEQMMQEKLHIALVVDDDNKNVGMITLEDIIEELVGEIEDEFDSLPVYMHPYGESFIVGGGVLMNTIFQAGGVSLPNHTKETSPQTLAQWCSQKSTSTLVGGQIVEDDFLKVLVRKLRRNKISEAVVTIKK